MSIFSSFPPPDASSGRPGGIWDAEMALIALCARPTLTAGHTARLTALLDGELDWERLFERARVHGVAGMVYHHLARHDKGDVPTSVLQAMAQLSRRTQAQNLHAMQELVHLAEAFSDAGIPLLTFKGPLLAHQYYGNVAFRQFGDIDLLVPRAHLDRAQALLEREDYRTARDLSDPDLEQRHEAHLGVEFTHRHRPFVVELHWALLNRTFSFRLDPEDIWARARPVSLGSAQVYSLAPDDLLLYLCAHGTKHHWSRLLCACDVAQVLEVHPGLTEDRLFKRARRMGSLRTLVLGLHLTERWLGHSLPAAAQDAATEDSMVGHLVHEIEDRWFGTKEGIHPPANGATLWFVLRTRERLRDNWAMLGHYLRLAIAPTDNDQEFVPTRLPRRFGALQYLVRPVRLLGEGLSRAWQALVSSVSPEVELPPTRPSLARRVLRLGRKWRRRSWAERRDLALAFGTATLVATLLHTFSFQRVLRLVDRWGQTNGPTAPFAETDERRLLRAVETVSRRLLPQRPCLTQALTARLLLDRCGARPTELQIGVSRSADGTIGAHAWLERDGGVIVGGRASPRVYAPLTARENETRSPLRPASPITDP